MLSAAATCAVCLAIWALPSSESHSNRWWYLESLETALDDSDHQITDHLAGIGDGRSGDNLPVKSADDEEDAHHLVITGVDLRMI